MLCFFALGTKNKGRAIFSIRNRLAIFLFKAISTAYQPHINRKSRVFNKLSTGEKWWSAIFAVN
jgi:hypothetical protein